MTGLEIEPDAGPGCFTVYLPMIVPPSLCEMIRTIIVSARSNHMIVYRGFTFLGIADADLMTGT